MQHVNYTIADAHNRHFLSSIARAREFGFETAKQTKDCLDEMISESGVSPSLGAARAKFKDMVVRDLTEAAEQRYTATVCKFAMRLMEHDRSLSADEAIAHVEAMVLAALLG